LKHSVQDLPPPTKYGSCSLEGVIAREC